ncbi:MAG: XdhC family protein [candidate division KSB1 bacterium]|nr:XdhC family protein [candidate division KSB1 bacterium]MDZ7369399.1 XdhC family protein [candidate division KSB1 bacterium]MDZ7407535.1 XdhC family protein [candidate division KSB1 bacterium]
MSKNFWNQVNSLTHAAEPFAIATVVRCEKPTSAKPGAKAIITSNGALRGWIGGACAEPIVRQEAMKALGDGKPRFLRIGPSVSDEVKSEAGVIEFLMTCHSGGTLEIYIEPVLPQPQLLLIGESPVVETLARLGRAVNFSVIVIDPDATQERFAEADKIFTELDLCQLKFTPQTYIVVATHGKYDERALEQILATEAPYIAFVTSKKRGQAAIDYLREIGISTEKLARIKFPAGLDIGAQTPDEIAVSILAEIVQIRRRPPSIKLPIMNVSAPQPAAIVVEMKGQAKDPICGMMVEIATARYTSIYEDDTYYFCCAHCKQKFDREPEKYVEQVAGKA